MKKIALVMVLFFSASALCLADEIGVSFTAPGAQNSSSLWSLGYQFTANTSATITGLGVFDFIQDGLDGAQQVGLWDGQGNLLASTFVDNSDALVNDFWRFHPISGVT